MDTDSKPPLDARHSAPGQSTRPLPPAPWAVWVAHTIPILLLPSALWRIAMVVGLPVGFTELELRDQYGLPGWGGAAYILALTVGLELLGMLSLGLVQRWGQIFPRWIPYVSGKRVPVRAVAICAGTGAGILTILAFSQLFVWPGNGHPSLPLMGLAYFPLLGWGPLLAILAIDYYRRNR